MPQQGARKWTVNYNGYQFQVNSPTEPTEQQAKWLYDDYVEGAGDFTKDSTNWLMPALLPEDTTQSLDFGYIETDLERAQRNSREIGSVIPDQEYRDATFMGRFWDSAASSAIPFGRYESTLSPADESSELWASALGGLVGALPSFIVASAVTGGVGGIGTSVARGGKVIQQYIKFKKAQDLSLKAAKLGRTKQAKRFKNIAKKIVDRNSGIFAKAIVAKEIPVTTGLLGASKLYTNKILKIAQKNPKLARSLNLFSNNVIAFNLYGQTRFPLSQIEGRLESLTADTAAGLVFSVAGIPTMIGASFRGATTVVEPLMLLGAGMYSDLMQSDMSMEERFIHGLTLAGFHYARQGLSRAHIKEKLETAIRTSIPGVDDIGIKNIVEGKGVKKQLDAIESYLSDNASKMHFSSRKTPGKNARIVRVRQTGKGKKPKHELMYEDIETGVVKRISGKTREEVLFKFGEKYEVNAPNLKGERVIGRDLDKADKKALKDLELTEEQFREAYQSNRREYKIEDRSFKGERAPDVKSPFKEVKGQKEREYLESKIDSFESELLQLAAKRVEDINNAKSDRARSSINSLYKGKVRVLDSSLKTLRKKLNEAINEVRTEDVEFLQGEEIFTGRTISRSKGEVPENWKIGDYVKIPLWNENTKSFEYTSAGIGKYVGKISDFKKGSVIVPESLKAEFVGENYPVFEVRTHGGSQVQKIAIGTKIPEKVINKIQEAKSSDKPKRTAKTKEAQEIINNPIVTIGEDGKPVYNTKSPLFTKLFTDKLSGKDAAERGEQAIEVDMARSWMVEKGKKASLSDRLADSTRRIRDPENALKTITEPRPKYPTKVYPRSSSGLKNLSKSLEEGLTPGRAKSFEESVIAKTVEKGTAEREKALEDWERLKNIDESDPNNWYNMNQMKKETLIDRKAYESYPEFDPLNQKPISLKFYYDKVTKGETKSVEFKDNTIEGKPMRFKNRKEATEWAETHWVQNEAIESRIQQIADKVGNIKQGDSYKKFRKEQIKLKRAQNDSNISDSEYRQLLKLFFPKSEGTSTKMTYEEVVAANALIETKTNTPSFEKKISSTVPPDNFMSKVDVKWRKFLLGAAKLTLPIYTVLGMAKSKAAQILAGKQIDFELMRQSISGEVAEWKRGLRKKYKLNQKQFEALSTILDGKYEDFYNPILDKLPKQEIINDYRIFSDGLALSMIEVKMDVKNGRNDGKREKLFETYDKDGTLIQLDVPWDAFRVTRGYEFLDSGLNSKMPSGLSKVVKKKITQDNIEYYKSLRVKNETTGEYDNGWFIIGKERFVPEWKGDKFQRVRRIGSKEVDVADGRKNVKMYKDSTSKKAGFKSNLQENYLMRMVTDEFRDLIGSSSNGRFVEDMALRISKTDPEFSKMEGNSYERYEAALAHVKQIRKYWMDSAGVFGTQWSRIAELPPVLLMEIGTRKLIDVPNFKDINGKPVKKGSTVIDKDGNKRKIGKVIDVYERNFDKIITRYGQKIAHIVPTYKFFGKDGANTKGETSKLFARLTLETGEDFSRWAHSQLELQVNSTSKNNPMEKTLNGLTMITAQLGLSGPFSGAKNFILGQTSNATVYGIRGALRGMYETMSDVGFYNTLTGVLGGKEAGVHELVSGRIRYTKYSPGLMRQTEVVNRIISVAAAKPMLVTHINNLNGVKTPMNKGMSEKTSMRILTDVFKFTTAEVKEMMKLGAERLHEKPNHIQRAQQMSHLITQGGPSLPFVPKWMGQWWSKPMTLFYRIAYRMTDNVYTHVIKPAIVDGNPVPLLRYATIVPIAGQAIYSMYYAVLGEETRNKFKTMSQQYWMSFIRAEGLAAFSNSVDEYGSALDSYRPVVLRTVESIFRETSATITGKKKIGQSLEDLAKENVVFLNHATRFVRKFTAPTEKKVEASRRRQRQFTDTYFRGKPTFGDELDFLTTRSPYYRTVKDSFWSEDAKVKAQAYYSALNYVIHHEIQKDPALIKVPHKARKMAKSILKSIISRSRPIPSSWRKKTTGKKTRYQIYYSKLKPEFQQEELELDKLYKQKVREFNSAINQYRNIYGMDAVYAPTEN